jgi:hypothetical protein
LQVDEDDDGIEEDISSEDLEDITEVDLEQDDDSDNEPEEAINCHTCGTYNAPGHGDICGTCGANPEEDREHF